MCLAFLFYIINALKCVFILNLKIIQELKQKLSPMLSFISLYLSPGMYLELCSVAPEIKAHQWPHSVAY